MPENTATSGRSRTSARTRKLAIAGAATLSAAALAFTLVPSGDTRPASEAVTTAPVVFSQEQVRDVKASITDQLAGATVKAEAAAAKKKAADAAAAKKAAAKKAAAKKAAAKKAAKKKAAKKKAAAKAAKERKAREAASRSAKRAALRKAAKKSYANNLDGWIREALDIMGRKGIPGSYNGLYRNIMRESTGNPNAVNGWDINAQNGTPSIGLLQVIQPTFNAYHVSGTSTSIYDPVANITAAANYAADRYGSIDNVNGAY
ncbi:transglycosylase SLT domain-containing protein [Streptomyces sp. ME02-8801-2C]|uniref:transglycosylase SLT domain-containing protein n=1 Tax=Streptomyces sp. ME02-8801-2C TaxID=3028680 RepID=UPI0029AABDBE|nr:transglycosylase SLT domain-containing protein [Streptomyces sp. ME02-8801-2C]MDX3450720.1 transglycosylase SLT domain-containing protein [Streptomyces sp. ME02-8801-2C]